MKLNLTAVLAASILMVPVMGFAQQSNAGLTRAQVRAELVQLEKAGYNPSRGQDTCYPADVQAATAKLQITNPVTSNAETSGYGDNGGGTSQAGSRAALSSAGRSIYFGH
jgi:hypothetical protein